MNRNCLLLFLFLPFVFAFSYDLSSNKKQDKKKLKGLKGIEYIEAAKDFSIEYLREDDYELAADFIKLARKKAVQIGGKPNGAQCYISYSQKVLEDSGLKKDHLLFMLNYLNSAHELDQSETTSNQIETILNQVNSTSKDPDVLSAVYALAQKVSNDVKIIEELTKTSAQSLEQEALQNELELRQADISRLNLESAKNQILIEYSARLLDSVKYQRTIDSLNSVAISNELARKNKVLALESQKNRLKNILLGIVALTLLLLAWFFRKSVRFNSVLKSQKEAIALEKQNSENLLFNILPENIAHELKENGFVTPKLHSKATVMFLDFIGFSHISKKLNTKQLITRLDKCFGIFDNLCDEHGVEKIKTIGDAYMCISGLEGTPQQGAKRMAELALAIQSYLTEWNVELVKNGDPEFQARIGIHTGEIAAGVVGKKKFSFDVWGDTVNISSRMESKGEAGKVNISASTFELIKDDFNFEHRGAIDVKNMNKMSMYFIKE